MRTPGFKMAAVEIQHKNCLQSSLQKKKICRPRSVRIGKNCALGLEYVPRPAASGRTQDLWHSFCQYGPPGQQITYIYISVLFSMADGQVKRKIFFLHTAGKRVHRGIQVTWYVRTIYLLAFAWPCFSSQPSSIIMFLCVMKVPEKL